MTTLTFIFMVLAFIIFILATFGVNHPRIALLPLGLAFWVLAALLNSRFPSLN